MRSLTGLLANPTSINKSRHDANKQKECIDFVVVDKVLIKNVRGRGETGKLKNYWKGALFEVIEKKDGRPVYVLRNKI